MVRFPRQRARIATCGNDVVIGLRYARWKPILGLWMPYIQMGQFEW